MKPDLAILFWFYKDVDLCTNRLRLLRRYNPKKQIFGLYGGAIEESETFKTKLSQYLDDFFCFTGNQETRWKWRNGDLLILDWFKHRGVSLTWDTIVVVQWDMLLFKPVDRLFAMLQKNEMLLSGVRPVAEIESWWLWTRATNPQERQSYLDFMDHIRNEFDYTAPSFASHFVVACLPRLFWNKFSAMKHPEAGYLEYKIPTLAKVFGIEVKARHPFETWWNRDPKVAKRPQFKHTIIADTYQLTLVKILMHLIVPTGSRLFHPYNGPFPLSLMECVRRIVSALRANVAAKISRARK